MASILELMGHVQQQGEMGRERGRENRLASLMSQAYQAPREQRQAIFGQMAQTSPGAAFDAQRHFDSADQAGYKRLGQAAAVFSTLPDDIKAQAYPQLARQAQEIGIPVPGEWNPEFAPNIQQLAQTLGAGSTQAEQFTLGPGSKRFDPSGKVIAEVPFAPANANLVPVPDGQGGTVLMEYDPRTRQLSLPQYPGQGQPAATAGAAPQIMGDALSSSMDPQAIQSEFKALAPQFGAQISSLTRTPERNAAVGGVPNSQHLAGTAGDFVVPEANKGAFRQAMQQRGFEVIDEGDHMHVELPPGRQVAQGGARLGYTPPKAPTKAQSDVERRVAMAREMGASEDEIRRLVLGNAAPKPAVDSKEVAKARQKIPQLKNAVRGVQRIGEALGKLSGGMVNTGPLDQYAQKFTKEGQELEAAVGAIQNSVLALTRVPGVGSQSDLEQRVAMLQYPSLDKAPEVNARTLQNLQLFMEDLQAAYDNVTSGQGGETPATGGVDDLLSKYGIR